MPSGGQQFRCSVMLDMIAAAIFTVSLLVLIYAASRKDNRQKARPAKQEVRVSERMPSPPAESGAAADESRGLMMERDRMREESGEPAMEKAAPPTSASGVVPRQKAAREYDRESERPDLGTLSAAPAPSAIPSALERRASLIYWERMCLKEEFDLIVSMHKPEVTVTGPTGSSVEQFDTVYHLPTAGHVRIIPVCSGCNISPSLRDIKVSELDSESRAEFKVLPLSVGRYDLTVEFQVVNQDGTIQTLGLEKVSVVIQAKPIQLNLGALSISVSRRVPTFFSMCGSLFGFASFVLTRLGISLQESLIAWAATVSTGFAGAMMILLAILLLFRGLRPLLREIKIQLK
jgi:hypothetical protein